MRKPISRWGEFSKGLWNNNPIIKQSLGLCPALAVTVSAINGLAMGLATTFVLVLSSLVVSSIRHWVPRQVRIAAHIVIIATMVTIVDLVMKARFPQLSSALGAYIPLIVVNCLILGRQETFASKNKPLTAFLDGLGAGLGFLAVLFVLGGIRELIGTGTFLGLQIMPKFFQPWLIMVLPGGAFLTLGMMLAITNAFIQHRQKKERRIHFAQISRLKEQEDTI